jgi:hypothetical protein
VSRFRFGGASLQKLETVDPQLDFLMREVMAKQLMDFTIIQGYRSLAQQEDLFESGASKVRRSKHNANPARAVDIAPYPVRWGDKDSPTRLKDVGNFYRLAGIVLATARELEIPIRWGGDWSMDGDIYDQDFDDLVHFELPS